MPLVLGASLREFEVNTATSQLSVNLGVSVESVVNASFLLLVEDDLQKLATIFLGADALAGNLDGVDEVGEDSIMDGGECPGTGTLLSLRCARAVGALGTGENAARGEEEDVAVGELLLELTGETMLVSIIPKKGKLGNVPLLHTVEALEGWDGDKDDNCLLAVANFELCKIKVSMRSPCYTTMVRSPSDSDSTTWASLPFLLGKERESSAPTSIAQRITCTASILYLKYDWYSRMYVCLPAAPASSFRSQRS